MWSVRLCALVVTAASAACSTLLVVRLPHDGCGCPTDPGRLASSHVYLPALVIAVVAVLQAWLDRAPARSPIPVAWLARRPARVRIAALWSGMAESRAVRWPLLSLHGVAVTALVGLLMFGCFSSMEGPGAAPFLATHTGLLLLVAAGAIGGSHTS